MVVGITQNDQDVSWDVFIVFWDIKDQLDLSKLSKLKAKVPVLFSEASQCII